MSLLSRFPKLASLKAQIRRAAAMGPSMRLRLFAFFMLLVATMVFAIICVLLSTSIFPSLSDENAKVLANELAGLTQKAEAQFGKISVHAIRLSRRLSDNIEKKLADNTLRVGSLPSQGNVLEEVLDGEYETLVLALKEIGCSGAFVILDATVDRAGMAKNSRAGLFIENAEPDLSSVAPPTISILRGPPNIGRKRSVPIDPRWALEFNVTDAPWYRIPRKTAGERPTFLNRLYYWQPAMVFENTDKEMMLCCVPLVSSDGSIFGVCGFEVSARLFRLTCMPVNQPWRGALCLMAPLEDSRIDLSKALLAGYYAGETRPAESLRVAPREDSEPLQTYRRGDGEVLMGLHRTVRLYPKDSPFADRQFAMALVVPRDEILASRVLLHRKVFLISLLLLLLGVSSSFVFSKWYIRPVLEGLNTLRSVPKEGGARIPPTKIPEIDDLIEFLYRQPEEDDREESPAPDGSWDGDSERPAALSSESFFETFVENTKTLSRAEKNVFNLYLEGHTAQEIAEMLSLSINTIKSHNKRIFKKLNVSSRRELLSYVQIFQKEGRSVK